MLEEAAGRARGHFKRRRDWKQVRVTGDDTSRCHGYLTLESRTVKLFQENVCLLNLQTNQERNDTNVQI